MSTEENTVDEQTEVEQPHPQPCAFCIGTGQVNVGFDGETESCTECGGEGFA